MAFKSEPKNEAIKTLALALAKKPVHCSGVVEVPADHLILFYNKGDTPRRLSFSNSTIDELDDLVAACQPASFGVNQQTVLDENYRKAGKLDLSDFAMHFHPEHLGIVNKIKNELFDEADKRKVFAELYKLNVYDPGSFFKAHKDTPRGESMFGSLVVALPARHSGGQLHIRHDSQEWIFDSSQQLGQDEAALNKVAFVAFYSDVEHEVAQVTSGHRVTLTYNLHFADENASHFAPLPSIPTVTPDKGSDFRQTLRGLLSNSNFIPDGGYLGFGLHHEYPVASADMSPVAHLESSLKGADAVVWDAAKELQLEAMLKVVYSFDDGEFVAAFDHIQDSRDWCEVENLWDMMGGQRQGEVFINEDGETTVHVQWVTPYATSQFKSAYVAYGNEPSIEYMYGGLNLWIKIPPSKNRTLTSQDAEATAQAVGDEGKAES